MKNFAVWLQFSAILGMLLVLDTHALEALIVIILMYDIGFHVPAMDKLIDYSNRLLKWLRKKLNFKRK